MSIPSLTVLCAQEIVNNENLLTLSLNTFPSELIEVIRNEEIISKWKWFVTPLANHSNTQFEFYVAPTTYKNFCVLCPSHQVEEYEFLFHSNQKKHDSSILSRIIEFVKEKGRINTTFLEDCFHQRFIYLCYHIPITDRIKPGSLESMITIAQIMLPDKNRQTVSVCIKTLSKINQIVKSKWSLQTYDKVRDFVIYYVNQLAIDISEKSCFSYWSIETDNRLYLAQHAKDENEAKQHLFGEYTGPTHRLLDD